MELMESRSAGAGPGHRVAAALTARRRQLPLCHISAGSVYPLIGQGMRSCHWAACMITL